MKKGLFYKILGVLLCALMVKAAFAAFPTHNDRSKVSDGCGACHAGHGRRNTPMLRKAVPGLCYECHGLSGVESSSIYYDMKKRYNHPVDDTAGKHKRNEILPEKSPAEPRHVSCLDCHDPHLSEKKHVTKGAVGYAPGLTRQRHADKEADICYKCHADSANRPLSTSNLKEEFDPLNASYHPIERVSKRRSESLMPKVSGEKMDCTHCHNPHGSDYQYMLRYRYNEADGPESQSAYELCYNCHRRDSILADRSFRHHRRHVVFASTSCRTCHTAHGSKNNTDLISFNRSVVRPNKKGMLNYIKTAKEVDCYLNCHGIEHIGGSIERK